MADPLIRLTIARAYPSIIEDSAQHIADERRAFLINRFTTSQQSVRSIIRDSWQRCAASLDPGKEMAPILLRDTVEIDNLIRKNELLLRATNPVIHRLKDLFAGSTYIIGLADTEGNILQVGGDQSILRQMERVGMTPGSNWSETNVGTNGIGTALVVKHAMVVMGPEHFCDDWQDLSCVTVPIYFPDGSKISGVLDVSGDYHLVHPFFTGILTAAALEIKENLNHLLGPPRESSPPFQISLSTLQTSALEEGIGRASFTPQQSSWYQFHKQFSGSSDNFNQRVITAERLSIASGLVSATLNLENVLSQVARQAAYLLDLDSAVVCVLDDLVKPFLVRTWSKKSSSFRELSELVRYLTLHTEVVKQLQESGEPIIIDDVYGALQLPQKMVQRHCVRALTLLPLLGTTYTTGFILVPHPVPYHWQPEDLHMGLIFSLHAATAIENARLFDTLQGHHCHIEALNEVNQFLNTLIDPIQQLGLLIEEIIDIMESDGGMILLNQGPNSDLVLSAHAGLADTDLTDLQDIANKSITNSYAVLVCRHMQNHNQDVNNFRNIKLSDVLVTPILAGIDRLGVLLVGFHQHREINSELLALFNSIGQLLGPSLKNAELLKVAGETQALQEADRIKSKFLIMISHNLRSPLTAIRTSVESMLDDSDRLLAKSHKSLLLNIISQSKRLGKLVDQLLELSQIDANALSLDRDWTELGSLIVDAVLKFKLLFPPCKIVQSLPKDLPLVFIDPELIIQVLWNLLENAYKYSPPDEEISIEAHSTCSEIFISVVDKGPGIPDEDHEKIFQYFYRLPREEKMHTSGSGLGLAICRGIIETHGGHIWVENRPGGGSIFSFALPYSSTDSTKLTEMENNYPKTTLWNEEAFSRPQLSN